MFMLVWFSVLGFSKHLTCVHMCIVHRRRCVCYIIIYFCSFVLQPTSFRTTPVRTNYPRSPSNQPQSSSHHYRVTTTIRARTHTTKHQHQLHSRSGRSPKKAPQTNKVRKTTKTKLVARNLCKRIPGTSISVRLNQSTR